MPGREQFNSNAALDMWAAGAPVKTILSSFPRKSGQSFTQESLLGAVAVARAAGDPRAIDRDKRRAKLVMYRSGS